MHLRRLIFEQARVEPNIFVTVLSDQEAQTQATALRTHYTHLAPRLFEGLERGDGAIIRLKRKRYSDPCFPRPLFSHCF